MATNILQSSGTAFPKRVQERGYHIVYREDQPNYCPGCGHSHWYIGRSMAECAFCHTALPLEVAPLVAGGAIVRTVSRSRAPVQPAFAA